MEINQFFFVELTQLVVKLADGQAIVVNAPIKVRQGAIARFLPLREMREDRFSQISFMLGGFTFRARRIKRFAASSGRET